MTNGTKNGIFKFLTSKGVETRCQKHFMSPDTVAQGSQKGRNNHKGKAGDCKEGTNPEN